MAAYSKPLPLADLDSQPYWDGAREGKLRAQQCSSCGSFRWPPQCFCPRCHSWEFSWVELSQTGTIASYVVVHQAPATFADDVPYVIVNVEMDGTDGQVVLTSNLLDVDEEKVRVGMRVGTVFDAVTPEVTLPKFRSID